jgi:hypothetical protein
VSVEPHVCSTAVTPIEAPGVGGDGERRLGRRLHQEVVDHALVLIGDVAQLARQRVDDVKVWDGQQLRFAVGQPSAAWHFGQCLLRHEL